MPFFLLRTPRLSFSRFAAASLGALSCAAFAPAAHADTFQITATSVNSFFISSNNLVARPGATAVNYDHVSDAGGDMKALLNGQSLVGAYCVGLIDTVYLNSSYNASTVTTNGTVFGETIQNAGKISWLMTHFSSAAASDLDKQKALQAAIWRTEYGTAFQLDGADNAKTGNNAATISNYQSYLSQLGNNTDLVSSVVWISPIKAAGQTSPKDPPTGGHYQAVVGLRASSAATPEPGSIALFATGVVPALGAFAARRRKRRA